MATTRNDFTFNLVGKRVELSRGEQTKLKQQYIYKGKSLAFYDTISRRINIVMHKRSDLIEYAEGMNNHVGSRLHKSGFHLQPRRSIRQLEKQLPGFDKVRDVSDMYSRIISHESIHKALDNIGELRACMEFDDLIG